MAMLTAGRADSMDKSQPSGTEGPLAGEVVLSALRSQVDELRAQEPRVRGEVAGAVTRMRVTTRQLRSTLRGFSRLLDREATRPVIEELRWLGAQLGEENDTEAMTTQFHDLIAELPANLLPHPVIDDLERELGRLADGGKHTVQAALDNDRYRALLDALDRLLEQPPLTHRATSPAATELPKNIAKALRKLDRRLEAAAALAPGTERDTALHQARKADKLVRYITETVAPVAGEPAGRLRRQTKKLQDLLGDYQDAVIARSLLHRLSEAAQANGQANVVYELLDALEQAREARVLNKLPRRVQRLHNDRTLSWLIPTAARDGAPLSDPPELATAG
jgi:CHAD domain-containing protein